LSRIKVSRQDGRTNKVAVIFEIRWCRGGCTAEAGSHLGGFLHVASYGVKAKLDVGKNTISDRE